MYDLEELLIYGITEIRIEKNELIEDFKKKLQRLSYDLWYQTLKGTNQLYVVDSFDLKAVEEFLQNEYRNANANNGGVMGGGGGAATTRHGEVKGQQVVKMEPQSKVLHTVAGTVNSPVKAFSSPKRNMTDLNALPNMAECTVGELFNYKNRVFLKIVFRSVIKNALVYQPQTLIQRQRLQ